MIEEKIDQNNDEIKVSVEESKEIIENEVN